MASKASAAVSTRASRLPAAAGGHPMGLVEEAHHRRQHVDLGEQALHHPHVAHHGGLLLRA